MHQFSAMSQMTPLCPPDFPKWDPIPTPVASHRNIPTAACCLTDTQFISWDSETMMKLTTLICHALTND